MWGRTVPIDYEAVIDYLLSQCDRDDPEGITLSFERARDWLEEQADAMLDLDPDATEDSALTEILLEHYWIGTIGRIVVTRVPGVVVFRNGKMYKLPLVRIELNYRT